MIVSSALQDLSEAITPENSASSSASGSSGNHHSSCFGGLSSKATLSDNRGGRGNEGVARMTSIEGSILVIDARENMPIIGKLDNIRKAPQDLPPGFKFKAALHREVADGAATMKGYKKLGEAVKWFQILRAVLVRVGTKNERTCSVFRTGWVPVYLDHLESGLCFLLSGLIFDILVEDGLALT
ncbi:hypothetical protein SLA2020_021520 [Shorea laevis]